MHYISRLSACKFSLKALLAVFFVFLVFSGFRADAQLHKDPWANYGGGSSDSGYGISLSAEYDAPAADLATTFKPAPALNLGVVRSFGDFTFNATLGYHVYSPKQAVFYYDDGAGGQGTIVYQNYPVYAFYVGAVYNLQLSDAVKLYAGLNWGLYYTHYAYDAEDQFSSNSIDLNEEELYVAPKIGLTYLLGGQISLGIEAKYNFFTPEGNSDTSPDVGTVYKSYAAGVVLTYRF